MATCSLRSIHFHNPMYSFLSLFYLFFHLPSAHALKFNYPNFSATPKLNVSGDAVIYPDGLLALTKNLRDDDNRFSVGRAVYPEEMQLFDSVTGKAADFITHFSFNISNLTPAEWGGDGITFFLAPNGSQVPENATGGCLALISNCEDYLNTTGKAIVAVEFDTFAYNNPWDSSVPTDNHLGIDINSIQSVTNLTLARKMNNGSRANAWITYNSTTTNLSVILTYDDNPSRNYSLSYGVDLSKYLPERVSVGFSSATGDSTEVHYIYSWEFNSTEFTSEPSNGGGGDIGLIPNNGGGGDIGLIVGCVVGGSLTVGGIILILVFWRRKRTRRGKKEDDAPDDSMDDEFEHGTGPRRLTYGELVQATNNFAEEGKLGEGGFGGVYRGFLTDLSLNVAVKRVSRRSKQGRKEYMAEVKIISKLRHKNLVQLVGWCHEKGELLLVYEFMPNGSLDSHLFGVEGMLSWALRYKIALGLASALLYLHEEWEQCVVHRDIKSSNVMLDSNFNVKLGDFGLARLMDQESGLKTTGLAGTFGYMAPEYINTGKASKGSDVFSFGVVALEIACGRRSMEPKQEEAHISLVAWVWESYGKGKLLDVVDKKLCMDFDVKQMEHLMIIGLWSAHPDHNLRPSIRQVIQALNFEAPLPNLPKKMPTPRFDTPTSSSSSTEPLLSDKAVTMGR